jgi:predicted DNA-binding transcriptional regulator AlpA
MMRFLTFAQLHERGILPSRQHTRRLIEQDIVPKPYRLGDPERGRLMWLEGDIEAYVARKLAERDQPRPRNAGNNVVPIRRGRRSRYGEVPIADPSSRPRFAADVGPRLILRRPTR